MKLKVTTPRFRKQRHYEVFLDQQNKPLVEFARHVAAECCYPADGDYTFYTESGKRLEPEKRLSDQVSDGDKLHLFLL